MREEKYRAIVALGLTIGTTVAAIYFRDSRILWVYLLPLLMMG